MFFNYSFRNDESQVVLGIATDCSLSFITAWVLILARTCEKVASDLEEID